MFLRSFLCRVFGLSLSCTPPFFSNGFSADRLRLFALGIGWLSIFWVFNNVLRLMFTPNDLLFGLF